MTGLYGVSCGHTKSPEKTFQAKPRAFKGENGPQESTSWKEA
jgi:hypothetical protein